MTAAVGNPLVVFADPQSASIDYMTDVLADRTEPYLLDDNGDPLTVSNKFPAGETAAAMVPHLQVRYDGTPVLIYPVWEWATIALVRWYDPSRKDDAKNAAALTDALFSTHPGSSAIWRVKPLSGRRPDVDPETQLYFVESTFRVSTKPAQL